MQEQIKRPTLMARLGGIGACTVAMAAALIAFPGIAYADGTTADTSFTLKSSDNQLSVTATPTIAMVFGSTGVFVTPDPEDITIENNCVMPVCVKAWTVSDVLTNTNPVVKSAFENSKANNTWYLTVDPNESDQPMELSQTMTATTTTNWNIASGGKLELTLEGAIKNVTGIDFSTAQDFMKVQWVFTTAQNTI